jgi:metal-responsive CopG/Arc/MetJ family transcriptional regulator
MSQGEYDQLTVQESENGRQEITEEARRGRNQKIIVDFPAQLVLRMGKMRGESSATRSAFIRSAVEQYVATLERLKLDKELAEGYAANAELDREIARTFVHVDTKLL